MKVTLSAPSRKVNLIYWNWEAINQMVVTNIFERFCLCVITLWQKMKV